MPDRKYPLNKTIHQLFEEQVEKTPDHTALVGGNPKSQITNHKKEVPFGQINAFGGNISITYSELNRKSDQLAYLLKQKGVEPDTIVAIMVERSIEMVIGVLGILKAGGAYLPIDPKDPAERIKLLLADSKARVLVREVSEVSEVNEVNEVSGWSVEILHTPTASPPQLDLAYILYTSGSTGTPKGVAVDHRSVVNLLFVLFEAYPIFPVDAYLLKTSFSFDVSVTELFGWFMGGSRLVILEKEGEKDPQTIINTIEKHQVTHINFAPAMFNAFTHQLDAQNIGKISSLKYICLAGEVLPPELVNRFWRLQTSIRLENLYGPTEGTVYASWYSLSQWDGTGSIPIGKPLPYMDLYILDKDGHPLPVGETGELCIAGIGVARGYLNNPELTAQKFGHDKRKKVSGKGIHMSYMSYRSYISNKIYKTGDLARWLPDGNIEFLGRIDFQVKIRGIRIELGEIESQLLMHKQVKEAVVTPKETKTGDKYLCAYIAAGRGDQGPRRVAMPGSSELKEYLLKTLPDYMIPSFFIFLEQLPLTSSGKVDRKALPEPEFKRKVQYTAPRNRLEENLVEIW
ncbi:MAG: amino acid adenylation domain-containing protein, partial [Candidatus Aminicenantes bacterium]